MSANETNDMNETTNETTAPTDQDIADQLAQLHRAFAAMMRPAFAADRLLAAEPAMTLSEALRSGLPVLH
jgi:hypothetical protein